MTHTPGPWVAEVSDGGTFGLYARTEQFGTQLLGEFYDEDMGDPVPARENMHLAAAAPELLEALESLIDDMAAGVSHTTGIHARCKALIAKARGAA